MEQIDTEVGVDAGISEDQTPEMPPPFAILYTNLNRRFMVGPICDLYYVGVPASNGF